MLRDPIQYPHDIGGILLLNDQEHGLHRKLLAAHFTRKGLEHVQGPKITILADLLIEKLKSELDKGNGLQEMGAWYTWLAFDVAGEITFSQSLNCIQNMECSPWMLQVTQAILQSIIASQLNRFGIIKLLKKLAPLLFLEKERQIKDFVSKRVEQRLREYKGGKDTKTDICITLYRANETMQMINDDCFSFILAGSITTATTLTAATWFMLNSPSVYLKAKRRNSDSL
jgi:cytochrome P450